MNCLIYNLFFRLDVRERACEFVFSRLLWIKYIKSFLTILLTNLTHWIDLYRFGKVFLTEIN